MAAVQMNPDLTKGLSLLLKKLMEPALAQRVNAVAYVALKGDKVTGLIRSGSKHVHVEAEPQSNGGFRLRYHMVQDVRQHLEDLLAEGQQDALIEQDAKPYSAQQSQKIGQVMREFAAGELRSSSGEIVTDKDQAKAIALSEAGIGKDGDMGLPYQALNMNDAEKDPRLAKFGLEGYNKPKRTPNHATKSHVVLAKEGDTIKLIRFGQQGVSGSPPREGESKSERSRRKSFKARHAANIAEGKLSAAYWADKEKWDEAEHLDSFDVLTGYFSDLAYSYVLDSKKCVRGMQCGDTCIDKREECVLETGESERGKKLHNAIHKGDQLMGFVGMDEKQRRQKRIGLIVSGMLGGVGLGAVTATAFGMAYGFNPKLAAVAIGAGAAYGAQAGAREEIYDPANKVMNMSPTQMEKLQKKELAKIEKKLGKKLTGTAKEIQVAAALHGRKGGDMKDLLTTQWDYVPIENDKAAKKFIKDLGLTKKEEMGKGLYGEVYDMGDGNVIKVGNITEDLNMAIMLGEAGVTPAVKDFGFISGTSSEYVIQEKADGFQSTYEWDLKGDAEFKAIESIAEKINKMHSLGVVHSDLHMNNMGVDKNGEGFVLDWGRAIDRESIESKQAAINKKGGGRYPNYSFEVDVFTELYRATGSLYGGKVGERTAILYRDNAEGGYARKAYELVSEFENTMASYELDVGETPDFFDGDYFSYQAELGRRWLEFSK